MKKIYKYLIVLGLCIVFIGATIPFSLVIFGGRENPTQSGYVRIYVNSTIHDQLFSEITRYKQDIVNQGYTADIIAWSNKSIYDLKQDLVNAYPQGLVGAVLIGQLPIAQFDYTGSIFACDFFFMDLDGFWFDASPPIPFNDGIIDYHDNSTGDLYPEIWIGRINPECLTLSNYTQIYKDYFDRNHAYRTGSLSRPHKALLYIDDSWSFWWDEYLSNFTAYSNIDCFYHNSTTIPSLYKQNLTQNYEFVQVMVHSDPWDHYWGLGNPPSEGYLNYLEIMALNTKPLFYNLYACSACNINAQDNLGTHYLFSNNTLAVVGSSKTGGMNMYQSFYDNLSVGYTFGEAFKNWFWNPTYGPYGTSYSHSLSMGMIILGDPLLTIL